MAIAINGPYLLIQNQICQKFTFFNTSLEFLASYLQFGMCSAQKKQSLNLGKSNLPFSVVSNLSSILLVFWSLKYDYSHKWAIFAYTKPNWPKKDENMYKNYRKYKKNGFGNNLKMTKTCFLRGTVGGLIVITKIEN